MEQIKQIGLVLAALGILSMIVSFLLPKAGMSKTVKASAGIFLILAAALPLADAKFSFQLDFSALREEKVQAMEEKARDSTLALTENALSDEVYRTLQKAGLSAKEIKVTLHIAKDNSISISRIALTARNEDISAISGLIEQEYGVQPQISVFDGQDGEDG